MLIAMFADIHANRQAFEACLADARGNGAQRSVLLGDYVGYGGDPDWVTDVVMNMVGEGALAVLGNHDHAVNVPSERMNLEAGIAIEWTRGELGREQRQFLADLPLSLSADDRLYVHADASDPGRWHYVVNIEGAAKSLAATSSHVTFCGHVHCPALYSRSATAKMTSFVPTSGVHIPLMPGRQWLAVLGSVGQPRDGDPAAAYLILDTDKNEITFCRVPYDVEAAAAQIRAHGLPIRLAQRLFEGH